MSGDHRLLHDLEADPAADARAAGRPADAPASTRAPTTLSTALCRPMSSRTTTGVPVVVEQPRGVQAAGACRTPAARSRSRSGSASSTVGGHPQVVPPGRRRARRSSASTSSMLSVPQTPQADEAAASPAYRSAGARRGGAAELDGDDVELLLGRERLRRCSSATVRRSVGGREHALGVQEAGGELEVVARGAHRHRDPLRPGGPARPAGSPAAPRSRAGPRAAARPAPVRTGAVTSCTRTRVLGPGRRSALMAASLYLRPRRRRGGRERRIGGGACAGDVARGDASRRLDHRGLLGARAGRLPVPGVRRVHAAGDGAADLASTPTSTSARRRPGWVPFLHVLDRIGQRAVCLPILGRRDLRGLPLPGVVAAGLGGRARRCSR